MYFCPSTMKLTAKILLERFAAVPYPCLRCVAVLGALVLLPHCAHQVAPSGGPPDETPPSVELSRPAYGTTGHPVGREIVCVFNEWIDPRTAQTGVAVHPLPPEGVEITVRGKTLRIDPRNEFAESTTYHVEIQRSLRDLRNNPLAAPYHIVFSTGARLDSGQLKGCVIEPDGSAIQAKVALLAVSPTRRHDSVYLDTPDYLVQTDSTGAFMFEHVRTDTFRLFAFNDGNNDNRLQAGREKVFTASTPEISVGNKAALVHLYPSSLDTSSLRLTSVSALGPDLVQTTWSRDTTGIMHSNPLEWIVVSLDTPATVYGVDSLIDNGGSRRSILRLDSALAPGGYLFRYEATVMLSEGEGQEPRADTIRFNALSVSDTTGPAVRVAGTGAGAPLDAAVRLIASEPARIVSDSLILFDTLQDTVPLLWDRAFHDTLILRPSRRLAPSSEYRLVLNRSDILDIAGNPARFPSDSSTWETVIRTVEGDDLCLLLQGTATCIEEHPDGVWRFNPIGGATPSTTPQRDGGFVFDSIPGGKGRLSWFVDRDRNGEPDRGHMLPWLSPEPHLSFPDTVEARPRWEIKGVTLTHCTRCRFGLTGESPPPSDSAQ